MTVNVEKLSQIREHEFIQSWYELTDSSHFWFKWRMAAALKQLDRLSIGRDQELQALEIGCGTGVLRAQFEAATRWVIDGTDLDYGALCQAQPGRGRILYYDIREEKLNEAYDIVILYDVLEHIEDTQPFLRSVLKHLKPGGLLLINVPAALSLYGDYDRAAGHVRRYTRKTLGREFSGLNLRIEDLRYWGFSLLPLLALRKLIQRLSGHRSLDDIIQSGFQPPNALVNQLLGVLMSIETFVLSAPPFGSSLLMVGCKTE
jgi:SAM-dependent methyltransferase